MPTTPTPGAEAEPRAGARPPPPEGPGTWVQDHLDAVYRFARRRLPAADAEEVASEAFQALFEAQARGAAPADPAGYLFGVARRRVADRFRRRARGLETQPLPPGWEGFCDRPLPDEAASDHELTEMVHVALGLLAVPERDLLWARYREGATVEALAARHGLTAKAIEMRLYRAREGLRKRLSDVGAAWGDAGAAGTPAPEGPA
jgi:RNA polymerase sigma factor (sigma-70 family)